MYQASTVKPPCVQVQVDGVELVEILCGSSPLEAFCLTCKANALQIKGARKCSNVQQGTQEAVLGCPAMHIQAFGQHMATKSSCHGENFAVDMLGSIWTTYT